MLGLMKKDFLLIKANIKSIVIIFIVYLILAIQGLFEITFLVPLIGIMLFISTFSYDDYNNWNAYAVTLPGGRKNVVKAKYIASIILIASLLILSLVLSMGINYFQNSAINFDDVVSSLFGTMFSSVLIVSMLYPIEFKFGASNGRIILFALVFGLFGIFTLVSRFIDMTLVVNALNKLEGYMGIIISLVSVVLLLISYLVSSKIYMNKEF